MKLKWVLSLGVIAIVLSGCAAVGYGVGGAGVARSEVKFKELEERVLALEGKKPSRHVIGDIGEECGL
jgi:hypothetical protein